MHIADGVLSAPVLIAGTAAAAVGVGYGLARTDYERLPRVAVLASAFYVASLIHQPIGPTSVHLVLNGLVGLLLGWAAMPALLVGCLLQALMFGYGGLTVLGVNTLNMALPAVACHYLFGPSVRASRRSVAFAGGFAAGGFAILLSAALTSTVLVAAGQAFHTVAVCVFLAHLPVAVVEGLVTANVVVFLKKVRPELLHAPVLEPCVVEAADA